MASVRECLPPEAPAWRIFTGGPRLFAHLGPGFAGAQVQQWGGAIDDIKVGDVVWIPPGRKHWHGATPTTRMTHIALQEHLDGNVVEWLEKVSDEQYRR